MASASAARISDRAPQSAQLRMVEAAPQSDFIITTTGGLNIVSEPHFAVLKDQCILANVGHFNREINIPALRAGALGYRLKGVDGSELVRAVLAVAAGDAVYGAAVARRIVAFYSGNRQRYTAQAFPDLTPRERDVLDLLATGARNHEIARRLARSVAPTAWLHRRAGRRGTARGRSHQFPMGCTGPPVGRRNARLSTWARRPWKARRRNQSAHR